MWRVYHQNMPQDTRTPAQGAKKTEKSLQSPASGDQVITRTMRVSDILTLLPNSEPLIAQYGLSCFSCSANDSENLEDGCRTHGMPEAEIDDLVTDLNELLKDRPARPQTLTVTAPAARALGELLAAEGKASWGLLVGLDAAGGFSMEFREKPAADDKQFHNDEVPEVRLFASATTLAGIGGATIDLRDGRFKLDLPESAAKKQCACNGGDCDCGGNCSCSK